MHWSANFKARCRAAVCPPAARFPEATHPIRTQRTFKSVIANQRARRCAPGNHHVFSHRDKRKAPIAIGEAQPKDLMHRASLSEPSCARSFAFGSG